MLVFLTRPRLDILGQLEPTHQDREGVSPTVGFMDDSDLHCAVHKEILDGNRSGLSIQRVSVFPQGIETQHLTRKRIRD